MSDPTEATWSGQWLADRLGLTLTTESPASPLALTDLVGLALRRNPRRAHLLVSSVLGKHVPADPAVVHGAGRLLGAMVADELADLRLVEPLAAVEEHGHDLRAAIHMPGLDHGLHALCYERA